MPGELFSGGFIVAKPSFEVFNKMKELIKKGDFRSGTGWEGSGVGWYWGGQTVQGFVPFFFQKKMPAGSSKVLVRCQYIHLGDESCKNFTLNKISIFNFGPKPFECPEFDFKTDRRVVAQAHRIWWEMIGKACEELKVKKPVCRGWHDYKPIDLKEKAELETTTPSSASTTQ
eukprot:TRINITY_DN3104_c0_g1_i1.p2 TRINITY_DN3104_c0_g1~~TRINITY_DN3104_c0_g1_i1.p2  ORF type:complete len:172 (-),score=30.82 TRINITY_DN3104_c0_g1_i1:289-804(-)